MAAPNPAELLELAVRAARAAGDLLLDRAGRPATGLEHKSSVTDPVSDADRDAEALIRTLLHQERPDDALLGEEGGASAGGTALRWVVDPLDGTVNYLYRFPAWSVSIACEDAAGGLVGVVLDPGRDELFTAVRGQGATCNGRPLHVRSGSELKTSLVGTGFGYRAAQRARQAEVAARLLAQVRDIRRAGSAALDLAWVAAGRLDGFYEHGLNPWDRAAGELLVREAGGRVSDLPAVDGLPAGIIAAGGAFSSLEAAIREAVAARSPFAIQ
jgi:myo-inositol-1(or 4)-monophosphatase